jgi:hypothetical protein
MKFDRILFVCKHRNIIAYSEFCRKIDADAKSLLSGKVELHRFLKITQP